MKTCSSSYRTTITRSFAMASNNFQLSLLVAICIYGSDSKQARVATFGLFLEVPILLGLTMSARVSSFILPEEMKIKCKN